MSPRHNDESHSLNQPVRSVHLDQTPVRPAPAGVAGSPGWCGAGKWFREAVARRCPAPLPLRCLVSQGNGSAGKWGRPWACSTVGRRRRTRRGGPLSAGRARPSPTTSPSASFPTWTTTPALLRRRARAPRAAHRRRRLRHRLARRTGASTPRSPRGSWGPSGSSPPGWGSRTRSRFADHIHEVLTLDLPYRGRHAARLPHRRDRAPHPEPGQPGPQQPLGCSRPPRSTCSASPRAAAACTPCIGDSPTPRASRASSTTPPTAGCPDADDRNGFVFALPYRHAIVLQPCSTAGRDPRRARAGARPTRSGCTPTGVSPVSMHAYHWLGRQITCLTTEDEDGSSACSPSRGARAVPGLLRRAAG